jgi:hypothetical protein
MINSWTDTIRNLVYWILLFLFIIITYSLSSTKIAKFSSLIER